LPRLPEPFLAFLRPRRAVSRELPVGSSGPCLMPAPGFFHPGNAHGIPPSRPCSAQRSKRVSTLQPPMPLESALRRSPRLRRVTPPGQQRTTEAAHLPSWRYAPLRFSLRASYPSASRGSLSRAFTRRPERRAEAQHPSSRVGTPELSVRGRFHQPLLPKEKRSSTDPFGVSSPRHSEHSLAAANTPFR